MYKYLRNLLVVLINMHIYVYYMCIKNYFTRLKNKNKREMDAEPKITEDY
jgi:uncharacterized protein (DUF362 family)